MTPEGTIVVNSCMSSSAKTNVRTAKRHLKALDSVTHYMMTDHIGMIRGDGDLARYIRFLTKSALANTENATLLLGKAGIMDELPF